MSTLLFIDDDVILLAQLASQLEEHGYRVLRASNLLQGEQLAAENTPALILLDPAIQQGAGWALLERLAPRIPIVVISSAGLEEEVVRGLDLGAADYLAKPFRTAELLARLRRILRTTGEAPPSEPTSSIPSTTNPVDRLRKSSVEQQQPADVGGRRKAGDALGERRIEVPIPDRRRRKQQEEEPVFISPEEEHQLFTQADLHTDEMHIDEINQLPLGQRLKTARQRRRITLVQAELDTKLRMSYIQAMEEEKFSLLPTGPASEEMLRTYATYLGLDIGAAQTEYRGRHYTAPTAPPLALGGHMPIRQLPRWITPVSAVILALVLGIGGIWAVNPQSVSNLGDRARLLVIPATATVTPLPSPLPTVTPTAPPTVTPSPSPTATAVATRTPSPTEEPTDPPTPTRRAVP